MAKMRVHELAKELNISNNDIKETKQIFIDGMNKSVQISKYSDNVEEELSRVGFTYPLGFILQNILELKQLKYARSPIIFCS